MREFVGYRYLSAVQRAKHRTKSRVRAKVEHAISVIKRVFGFIKVRYRDLAKNAHRLFVTAALANLFMARRYRCDDNGRHVPAER
jgi:transposase, IS5 family